MDTPTFREMYFSNPGVEFKLNLDRITENDSENRSPSRSQDQFYSPTRSGPLQEHTQKVQPESTREQGETQLLNSN